MTKKEYKSPEFRVIHIDADSILAGSVTMMMYNDEVTDPTTTETDTPEGYGLQW